MIKGECLCQGITYEYYGEIEELAICNCNMCKRAQGTAFATNAPIEAEKLKFTSGKDLLKAYYSSSNKKRVFCSKCGSPIYSQRDDKPEIVRLRVGTVTEGHIPEPHYHIYHDYKAEWLVLDGKPTFNEGKK